MRGAAQARALDAVAPELMAVRPDLTSAWGGIEVASDGHPAHFYFYDFCIDSGLTTLSIVRSCSAPNTVWNT